MRDDFLDTICPIVLTAYTFIGHRNQGYSKEVVEAFLKGKKQRV